MTLSAPTTTLLVIRPLSKCGLIACIRRLLLVIGITCFMAGPALALTCEERLIQITVDCMKGDLGKAYECRAEAERLGCGSAVDDRCEAEVRDGVDWVFRDKGANATYQRKIQQGMSPFEAVVAAQGHNPPFQKQLRGCSTYVADYLASKGEQPNEDTLPSRKLTSKDCSCICVLPAGSRYRVTNSCDKMKIAIQFTDAMNTTRTAWVSAGILGGGESSAISAPAYAIPSLQASGLRNGTSELTCRF